MSDISDIRYIKNQKINLTIPTKKGSERLRKLQRFLNKTINLGIIFEKSNNNFTDAALLYQDILRFSFFKVHNDENGSFKYSELGKWLIKNNTELRNYYSDHKRRNTPINNRLHNHENRIKNKIDDLISINLLYLKGRVLASKVDHQVESYEITMEGKFLTLLIKSIENTTSDSKDNDRSISERKESIPLDNKLYEVLNSLLLNNDSYFVVFYRSYLKKLYDKQFFYRFKSYLYKLCYENKEIQNVNDLLKSIIVYDLLPQDLNDRRIFYDTWKETLEELDYESKQIILYNLKIYFESLFKKTSFITREYEKYNFSKKADCENITLNGQCEKCNRFNLKLYSIVEYKYEISHNSDANDAIKFDCSYCNSTKCCLIPRFQLVYP